jgi:RNA polymerase sigma factor (sigma-70 family)
MRDRVGGRPSDTLERVKCSEGTLPPNEALDDIDHHYRRYGPMVHRRCLQLLKDEARAADALQDVFVQLLRYRRALTAAAPSSLLNRIATNVCLNCLRGTVIRGEDGEETILSVISNAEDLESHVGARRFLAGLFWREEPSTRTIAVMHYVDGMTLEEVAQEVRLSVSGVRRRLRRLRSNALRLAEIP